MPTNNNVHTLRLITEHYALLAHHEEAVLEAADLLEKLPVTADGVTVIPDDRVKVFAFIDGKIRFTRYLCGSLASGWTATFYYDKQLDNIGVRVVSQSSDVFYSTRAAAEAALQEQQNEQNK